MKYDQKNICDFFRFFMNFVSSFAQWLHGNSVCTGYVPFYDIHGYPNTVLLSSMQETISNVNRIKNSQLSGC
jgi:hypothetical protein